MIRKINILAASKVFSLLLVLSLLWSACKEKEQEEPTPKDPVMPELTIGIGYFENFSSYNFSDQNTVFVDSLLPGRLLNLRFTESGLTDNPSLDIDSLQFSFSMDSYLDHEEFSTLSNAGMYSRSIIAFNNLIELEADLQIPTKFTTVPIANNDTLEVNPSGDVLSIDYSSYHSSLESSKSWNVK